MGQTDRNFKIRYKDYVNDVRSNNSTPRSFLSQHIPETGHTLSKLEDSVDILHIHKKYKYLSFFEQLHICGNVKQRFPIQDTCEDVFDPIFDVIFKYKTAEQNKMVLESATGLHRLNIATKNSTTQLHNNLPASGSVSS
jgi:hypothetical protein